MTYVSYLFTYLTSLYLSTCLHFCTFLTCLNFLRVYRAFIYLRTNILFTCSRFSDRPSYLLRNMILLKCFKLFACLACLNFLHALFCFIFSSQTSNKGGKRGTDWLFLIFPDIYRGRLDLFWVFKLRSYFLKILFTLPNRQPTNYMITFFLTFLNATSFISPSCLLLDCRKSSTSIFFALLMCIFFTCLHFLCTLHVSPIKHVPSILFFLTRRFLN